MPKRVVHLVNGLRLGGAETMLYQILKYRTNLAQEQLVISLGESHFYENKIRDLGIQVIEFPFRNCPLGSIIKIIKILKTTDVLCCWLYHSNFFGFFAGRIAGVDRIIWCIRHSNLDKSKNKLSTLLINRICARLSNSVDIVAYNGNISRQVHEKIGYASEKSVVLMNGVDCVQYSPLRGARDSIIHEFCIPKEKKIILSVTRNHPIKDLPCFVKAFANLHNGNPNVVAIICGEGVDYDDVNIVKLCTQSGLSVGKDVLLLGVRQDIARLMTSCDLYVLHSAGEAFPNVLVQAMACGCLCLSTEVGDARDILDDNEMIIPPGNNRILGEKMKWALQLPMHVINEKKEHARNRAKQHYDIHEIVKGYEKVICVKS